jgi:cytochrome c-type biogenesis protein CcmH/NrfG
LLSAKRDARILLMSSYFWFIAGTLTGFAAALVIVPLARGVVAGLARRPIRIAAASGGGILFALTAVLLYRAFGNPDLLSAGPAAGRSPHPGLAQSSGQRSADSMESAVAGLEARVTRDGGKREDWLLLAQSYDFLGRAADAERARKNAESGGGTALTTSAQSPDPAPPTAQPESAAELERSVRSNPRNASAWLALAESYRRQHDYAQARDAYEHLEKLNAMTADTWADQADVLASLAGGSLRGKAAHSIDRALALDAQHAKALWLKASLAHEEHRYRDALSVWKDLRAALPPGSPDLRIVDANIVESSQLAGVSSAAPAMPAPHSAATGAEVSGTISIDQRLASRVPPGATLYIYAKAADSPGPPLAVLRQAAGTWPVSFRLDDTLAMIPTRKLSQFERVVIEARVSPSGQATPTRGDLYVTSAVLKPGDSRKLQLVIDHEVS